MSNQATPPVPDPPPDSPPERAAPEAIRAIPVRHPGRWLAAGGVAVLAAMFAHVLLTNEAFQWSFVFENLFTPPILRGVRTVVVITLLAMAIGITLGIVVAMMRLSANPLLSGAAWFYTWFFRAVPRIVLLVLFGNLGILWDRLEFGLPFDRQIGALFGIQDFQARIFGFDARTVLTGFVAGLLGLALSEAAYMAEIVRAGILSVDPGQSEAAAALGLSRPQTLRRVVLPQAMRAIIPPTGNELIALLKDTALLAYVPVTNELWFQTQAIGARTFRIFPMLVAACMWYLFLTSVLMVLQNFVERYFARGYGAARDRARVRLRSFTRGQGGA
ncbi:amino acid ABC transporter permease [Natronosporangium hydrolyticum]|uniref:Amino acid ABC transporter permease n=1 Tax=Natronosporangium hydrolyticum TaxID=2811111 RepID=A0A895Y7K2_9ACTN|nr:amino acid ABC transporter permease [Natronosporangium hydrolyticum]QSB13697.1 amino acid ABC transporter permease [Natronosporangium hydrolyticum]